MIQVNFIIRLQAIKIYIIIKRTIMDSLHDFLEVRLKIQTKYARARKLIFYATKDLDLLCCKITDVVEAGVNLGDHLDHCLLTLLIYYYNEGDIKKCHDSPVVQLLLKHRYAVHQFGGEDRANLGKFLDASNQNPLLQQAIQAVPVVSS